MIPIVRYSGTSPLAYTDFSKIYISDILAGEAYRTVLRHERAHISLQHQRRSREMHERLGDAYNHKRWILAADFEIARHIYDERDVAALNAPRSPLDAGVKPSNAAEFPQCEFAEDFYTVLKDETVQKLSEQLEDLLDLGAPMPPGQGGGPISLPELLVKALVEIAEAQATDDRNAQIEFVQRKAAAFKPPKPSLGGLVDAALGRAARVSVPSFRRPSRREGTHDLIKKGRANVYKVPKITIYVDRSGSFDAEKTAKATQALKDVLMKYRARLQQDVIYFNDDLMTVDPMQGDRGTNYQAVVDSLSQDMPQLGLIITDDDSAGGVTVPDNMPKVIVLPVGCVTTEIGKLLRAPHANV